MPGTIWTGGSAVLVGGSDGSVSVVPVAGGELTALASGLTDPRSLVVTDAGLAWTGPEGLWIALRAP